MVAGVGWDSWASVSCLELSVFPYPGPSSFPQAGTHFPNLPVPCLLSLLPSLPSSCYECGVTSFFHSYMYSQVCVRVQDGAVAHFLPASSSASGSARTLQRNRTRNQLAHLWAPTSLKSVGPPSWLAAQAGAVTAFLRHYFFFRRETPVSLSKPFNGLDEASSHS